MEDFASFDFTDFEDNTAADARRARIEEARRQARQYEAKIEQSNWYLPEPTTSSTSKSKGSVTSTNRDAHRRAMFTIQHHYLERSFSTAYRLALELVEKGSDLKKEGADEVELLDFVLKSFLKLQARDQGLEVPKEVVEVARRWTRHRTFATFTSTASQILLLSPPSMLESPQEPLSPILNSLKWHPTQPRYLQQLETVLQHLDLSSLLQALAKKGIDQEAMTEELEGLHLDELERTTLEKVLGMHGEVKEEEEKLRDVRSL